MAETGQIASHAPQPVHERDEGLDIFRLAVILAEFELDN